MFAIGERFRSDTRFAVGVFSLVMGSAYPMFSFQQIGPIVAGVALLSTVKNGRRITTRGRISTLIAIACFVAGASEIRISGGGIHGYLMMVSLAVITGIEFSTRGSPLDEE